MTDQTPQPAPAHPSFKIKNKQSPIPGWLGAVLSIVPGLGQIVARQITRGFLLTFSIFTLYGLALWRLNAANIEYQLFPPEILTKTFSRPQEEAYLYASLAIIFATLGYLWNIFDGYACAKNRPSPPRLGFIFLLIATLILGAHITEIDVAKAYRERSDIVPRLAQILWPWEPDEILERDIEQTDGVANWETPCTDDGEPVPQPDVDEDEPRIEIEPDCGNISGLRSPSGRRIPGTEVTVRGFNFEPGKPASVVIKPSSIPEFRLIEDGQRVHITPGENGEFEFSFVMPNFTIPSTSVGATRVQIIMRQTEEVGTPYLVEDFWLSLEAIIETVFLALMATAVGLVLAVPLSFLAARNLMATNPLTVAIYYMVRLVMNVVRSIEPLIWALIAIVWVGPGPFAGVIALTVHTIAALGKLYSESIENIDDGPIEAVQATGANRVQTIVYAVVPQIIPPFVSFTIYRWDINVRMSTIIGAVGGGGIGTILVQWIRLANYDAVGIAVWMIAIVVIALDYTSARIREMYV